MPNNLYNTMYNPDVLSCIANLSNDEVFTPPEIANAMLDMLPQELFSDPNTTFLDPACKSGVFLREIAKRLLIGLKPIIPDLQERTEHIFKKQIFGIAITELTSHLSRRSLYCSKTANGNYSVVNFDTVDGNVRFKTIRHRWQNGKCVFCGASQEQYDRDESLEAHAYELIHTTKPEEIFKMKFDVIISNPPYQLSDGGYGVSASPIYQMFVEQAKKLNPRYLTMIIPARWYSGGKGLDAFRKNMLNDRHIRIIHDFPEASDCFSGVQIKGGVCYFLWDKDHAGDCAVITHHNDQICDPCVRPLLEDGCDIFIRYNIAVDILQKVKAKSESTMEPLVSSQKPFGLRTYVHGSSSPKPDSIVLYENEGRSYISRNEVTRFHDWIDAHKVFIPAAGSGSDAFPHPILGRPFYGEPGSASTETYCVIGPFESKEICMNVISYIKTKFFRFLVMLMKPTQHAPAKVYGFVPVQDFSKLWTDDDLYAKYGLTDEEIAFIDSMIKPME